MILLLCYIKNFIFLFQWRTIISDNRTFISSTLKKKKKKKKNIFKKIKNKILY